MKLNDILKHLDIKDIMMNKFVAEAETMADRSFARGYLEAIHELKLKINMLAHEDNLE